MRYYAARFASEVPSWRLPLCGGVAELVTEGGEEVGVVRVVLCIEVGTGVRAGAYPLRDATAFWLY